MGKLLYKDMAFLKLMFEPDFVSWWSCGNVMQVVTKALPAPANFALPEQILARLQSRPLELLVDGCVDLPSRQRTLRAAIESSYRLLNEGEATLIQQALALFLGGCTPAMAEEVWTDDSVAAAQTGKMLRLLASKSLIRLGTTE